MFTDQAVSKTPYQTIHLSPAASDSMGRAVGSELMPCLKI
jgi:hypothetical protein